MAKNKIKPYGKDEMSYLKNLGYTAGDIAFMLGRSTAAVATKRYVMANPKRTAEVKREMKRRMREAEREALGGVRKYDLWTKEEEHLVMTSRKTDKEIAKLIGRTINSVQKKRHRIIKEKERKEECRLMDIAAKNAAKGSRTSTPSCSKEKSPAPNAKGKRKETSEATETAKS